MSSSATLNQRAFRVRTDTAAADTGTPTWAAAENTSVSIAVETTFRLRFSINNTGTANSTTPTVLRVSKNSGVYTAVTTSSGATLGAQATDASSSADASTIATANFRLSAGTGTTQIGVYSEVGSVIGTIDFGRYTELEFGLILKTAGATAGDTFDFRLYNNTTAFTTYTQTPRITVPESSGTNFAPKYDPTQSTVAFFEYLAAGHASTTQTMARAVAVGDLHVVFYAVDNVATTDGDEAAVTSITDTAGNTYTKAAEWTKSGGALQGGVTAGIWYNQITSALSTSNTLTINWSSSTNRDAVAFEARAFTVAGDQTVSVEATATGVATASTAVPSLNPATANIECLRFRVNGVESNIDQGFHSSGGARRTAGWSATLSRAGSSGTAATSIAVVSESLISTGTGGASSPSALSAACDQVGVYVAFKAGLPNHACLANDVSSASSVSGDPATVVLIHANGVDGSTTFIDATGKHTVTATGNAQVDTGQSKFGGASAQTTGTGNSTDTPSYLSISNAADLAFGTGDFTIDFWMRATAVPAVASIILDWRSGGADGPQPMLGLASSVNLYYWVNGGYQIVVAAPSFDTWHHIALTRVGTSTRLFIDGVAGSPITDTTNYTSPSNPSFMGGASGYNLPGWLDEIRIIKGYAAWTADFTPPTSAYNGNPALTSGGPARLLDTYPSACFAYSFRKLRAFYTGNAVRIRRVSDNVEADVGFDSSGNFDTAAAAAHIGGSTGRIVTWYDQSDNGRHITQATAGNQPLYSATGLNSLPTVDFNASSGDEGLFNSAIPLSAIPAPTTTIMSVLSDQVASQASTLFSWDVGATYNRFSSHAAYANTIYWDYGTSDSGLGRISAAVPSGWNTGGHLLEIGREATTNNQYIVVDGVTLVSGARTWLPVTVTTTGWSVGTASNGTLPFDGLVSELVVWTADLGANRTAARTNVQTYWLSTASNACLANDIVSASLVTNPAVQQLQTLLANDVLSPSSVTKPTQLRQVQALLANDVKSNSAVSIPAATIRRDVLANDVLSASSVKQATALINRGALANDVVSPSSVTQPAVHQTGGLLANDVLSTSSVSSPTLAIVAGGGVDACTANDIVSLSSVTQPQVSQAQSLLANDVVSASSVTRPAVTQLQAILANDVKSPSSVSQPIAGIRRDVLANDVVSPSKVTNPLAVIGRTILANDVVSPSSVSQPLAVIQRAILANDVVSPSKVSNPVLGIVGTLDARDINSASSVTQPAFKSLQGLLANDVKSASSVSQPVALILRNILANDITSASSVSKPVVGEITAGQPLANDVISRSSVSIPTLVVVGQPPITVPPIVPPAHGGGAGYIGAKAKEHLAELIEIAYRKALKIKEPEVVEAIRAAVKEAIPERQAQRLRSEDFARLAADLSVVKGLLAEIQQQAREIEIQAAIDALIEYELALEEDDAEALLIAA